MSEVKNIPILRFPEFFGGWGNKRLDEISEFRRGSFPQPYGLPEWYDDENGSPFVQVYDVDDNFKLKPKTKQKISVLAQPKSVFVPKGSVIITIQGSIGRVAITQYDSFVDRTLLIFTTLSNQLNKWFFSYQLDLLFENEKRTAPGGTIKTITKEVLSAFSITLPSLPEQQKIADFLTAVDKRIELLEKKKTLLETYKKGVMKKIFNQEIRFKDDNGNDFPDWEEKRLGDLFNFIRGSSLSKSDLDVDGEFKCIHYGELFTIYKEVIRTIVSKTNKDGTRSIHGDILMPTSDVTPFGLATASCIQEKDVILGGDMNILRSKSNIEPVFFSYLLNFNVGSIIKLVTGTTIKHIYSKDLKPLRFNVPNDKTEQMRISEFFCSIDLQIELFQTQIDKSKTWKKGLLQKMFV